MIILMISLAVSAWASSSRLALAVLLAFWVVNCLIVPRAGADLAKRLHPTPSTIKFSREMEKEILHSEQGRNENLKQRALDEYGVSRVEDLPFNFEGLDLQDSEERGNSVIDRYYSELHGVFARQLSLQEAGAILAPHQAARMLSMGLAGTDPAQQIEFSRAAPVIALAISLSLAGALWSGAKPTSGDLPARLSLWTLAVSVYGLFWFAVAVAVNAFGRSSAANAVALACAWLTLVIILPALITVYAQWRYAVPSRLAFINAVRDEQRATAAKGPELRERFYAEHPELKPADVTNPGLTIGRNSLRSPRARFYDVSLAKRFTPAEGVALGFEINAFNLFNQVNFAAPASVLTSPFFGQVTRTRVGTNPRQLQLGLKLSF